jgi:hypothetical protein
MTLRLAREGGLRTTVDFVAPGRAGRGWDGRIAMGRIRVPSSVRLQNCYNQSIRPSNTEASPTKKLV